MSGKPRMCLNPMRDQTGGCKNKSFPTRREINNSGLPYGGNIVENKELNSGGDLSLFCLFCFLDTVRDWVLLQYC